MRNNLASSRKSVKIRGIEGVGGMKKSWVLFVDYEPLIVESLKRMLNRHKGDWEMTFLADPIEARKSIGENPFDVVVSDMKMPKLNGLELSKQLCAMDRDVKTIILTGTADLSGAIEAINETAVMRFIPSLALHTGWRRAFEMRLMNARTALKRVYPRGGSPWHNRVSERPP